MLVANGGQSGKSLLSNLPRRRLQSENGTDMIPDLVAFKSKDQSPMISKQVKLAKSHSIAVPIYQALIQSSLVDIRRDSNSIGSLKHQAKQANHQPANESGQRELIPETISDDSDDSPKSKNVQ